MMGISQAKTNSKSCKDLGFKETRAHKATPTSLAERKRKNSFEHTKNYQIKDLATYFSNFHSRPPHLVDPVPLAAAICGHPCR